MLIAYTTRYYGLTSFPRKRESRRQVLWGLDARRRGHDVLLVPNLCNGHLPRKLRSRSGFSPTRQLMRYM